MLCLYDCTVRRWYRRISSLSLVLCQTLLFYRVKVSSRQISLFCLSFSLRFWRCHRRPPTKKGIHPFLLPTFGLSSASQWLYNTRSVLNEGSRMSAVAAVPTVSPSDASFQCCYDTSESVYKALPALVVPAMVSCARYSNQPQ